MLKKFEDEGSFIENIGFNRSTVYFIIGLYKFLKKFPTTKNSSLSWHYFRNNFKFGKTVCKSNEELYKWFYDYCFFTIRLFLSPCNFFFSLETFSFPVRFFLSFRRFSNWKLFYLKLKFLVNHAIRIWQTM